MSQSKTVGDGTYQVLVKLSQGVESYRVIAALIIAGPNAHLEFHRFAGTCNDGSSSMSKVQVNIARPQLQLAQSLLTGVDYILSSPVHLDAAAAKAVFGC